MRTVDAAAGIVGGLALVLASACAGVEESTPVEPATPAVAAAPAEPAPPEPPVPPAPDGTTRGKPQAESLKAIVEHLLECIATSPLVFIRNGEEQTGGEASKRIRAAYENDRQEIATPEDFIARAATKSESGQPDLVKLADGTQVPLAGWLMERLTVYRAENGPTR